MRENRLTFCGGPSRAHRACLWLASSCLAFPPLALFGQSLHLSPTRASPGMQVSINVSLTSPGGKEPPSALQWETTIPIALMGFVDENLSPGPEAQAAGKSVSCRVRSKTATTQTSTCILYGGREPIRNGLVAVLRLKISPDASPGSARIRIDQAIAVLKD